MYRRGVIALCAFLALLAGGCGRSSGPDDGDRKEVGAGVPFEESIQIAKGYRDIYKKAVKEGADGTLETTRLIVERIGKEGYAAIDYDNQVNMQNPDKVRTFARKVEEKKEAGVSLFIVNDGGGFTRYDLKTADGNVDVVKSSLYWEGAAPKSDYKEEYRTKTWVCDEGGYLFFERNNLTGAGSGRVAVRLQPLDDTCRELNRKYLLPAGYHQNNMFTTDWNEDDYGNLNLYDLYEKLYMMKTGEESPYEFAFTGRTYEVPEEEFEAVFHDFFQIDSQMIRQRTTYHEGTHTYQYRPRGLYDKGTTPDVPFPEVVSYEENGDGTLKLTVNAVWPKKSLERAFRHEVVVRPLNGDGYQYVSNHVIPSDDNVEPEWYMERLTEEQWQEYYGGNG